MSELNSADITALREENDRLQRTIQELSILNEIATALSSAKSYEEIERLIIKKSIRYLNVEEGVIMLLDQPDNSGAFTTLLRTQNSLLNFLPYKLDDQIMGWILKNKSALIVDDFINDIRFDHGSTTQSKIKSLLCVPMFIKGRIMGVITLFNKINGSFTDDDKRLLSICAAQSAQIIENARLYEIETAHQNIQKEIALASQIQCNLLPKTNLSIGGISVTAKTKSAHNVGGDFYDFIPLPGNKLAVWLGDIAGKGMPAALLMANLQGVLRSQSIADRICGEIVSDANDIMVQNSDADKFATLFYAIADTFTGNINYISAGHNELLYVDSDGHITSFVSKDLPIGIYTGILFHQKTIELKSGDILFVYSDGITESENPAEERFQLNRLRSIIENNYRLPPEVLIEKIFSSVFEFSNSKELYDDQTILIIKRN